MGLDPFEVKSCALIVRMDGLPSTVNLRELRDRAERCSAASIYHHFIEGPLRPTFDDPEYTNDFAIWAYRALRDDVLAERLAILDPFSSDSIDSLRSDLLEILEERLSEIDRIPWAAQGQAFYFMRASMIVFDTSMRLERPKDILWALERMTGPSIYYHFVEARVRLQGRTDDFSAWLREGGSVGRRLADAFSTVEVQFYSLRGLQRELLLRADEAVKETRGDLG